MNSIEFPVSNVEEMRLLAKTSGETSRKMKFEARRRRKRAAWRVSRHILEPNGRQR